MTAGRKSNPTSVDWCTPSKYVEAVKQVFGGSIAFDPCSNEWSIVHAKTEIRLPENGLLKCWQYPTIFVNPPYGADRQRGTTIRDWLERCVWAYINGSEILALVPVATNTRHWKECVWPWANSICFLYDTRLRFLIEGKDTGKGAPMACAMIYWGNGTSFETVFENFGAVVRL